MKIYTYWNWETFIFGVSVMRFGYTSTSIGFHIGFFQIDIEIPQKSKEKKK